MAIEQNQSYRDAVDYLTNALNEMESVWKDPELPGIETAMEHALYVLKSQEFYGEGSITRQ